MTTENKPWWADSFNAKLEQLSKNGEPKTPEDAMGYYDEVKSFISMVESETQRQTRQEDLKNLVSRIIRNGYGDVQAILSIVQGYAEEHNIELK